MARGRERPELSTAEKVGAAGIVIGVGLMLLPVIVYFGFRATLWTVSVEPGEREVELDAGTVFIYPGSDSGRLSESFAITDESGQELFVDFQGELGYSVRIPSDDVYLISTEQPVEFGDDRGVPALFALLVGLVCIPLGLLSVVVGLILFIVRRNRTSPRPASA